MKLSRKAYREAKNQFGKNPAGGRMGVEKVTALAFEMPTDKLKLKLLTSIDGVGASVASDLLTCLPHSIPM